MFYAFKQVHVLEATFGPPDKFKLEGKILKEWDWGILWEQYTCFALVFEENNQESLKKATVMHFKRGSRKKSKLNAQNSGSLRGRSC